MTTNPDKNDALSGSVGASERDADELAFDGSEHDEGSNGQGRRRFRLRRKDGDGPPHGQVSPSVGEIDGAGDAQAHVDATQPGLPQPRRQGPPPNGPATSPVGLQRAARRPFDERRALALAGATSEEWREIAAGLDRLGVVVAARTTRGAIIKRDLVINDENLRMLFVATISSAMQTLPLIVRTGVYVRATQAIAEAQIPLVEAAFKRMDAMIGAVQREVDARMQESGITAQDVEQSFYRKAPLKSSLPIMCGLQNRLLTSLLLADRTLRATDVLFALDVADLAECKRWRETMLEPMRQLSTTIYKGSKLIYRVLNVAPPVRQSPGAEPALAAAANSGPATGQTPVPAAEPVSALNGSQAHPAAAAGLKIVASASSSPVDEASGQAARKPVSGAARARA